MLIKPFYQHLKKNLACASQLTGMMLVWAVKITILIWPACFNKSLSTLDVYEVIRIKIKINIYINIDF